jgi:hypothetical protein
MIEFFGDDKLGDLEEVDEDELCDWAEWNSSGNHGSIFYMSTLLSNLHILNSLETHCELHLFCASKIFVLNILLNILENGRMRKRDARQRKHIKTTLYWVVYYWSVTETSIYREVMSNKQVI